MKYPIATLLFAVCAPAFSAENYSPKVGNPHRDFVLPDIQTGKAVSLRDYRGKKVLLFHFASW